MEIPTVGTPATICGWTDRYPAYVVRVSATGKTIWLQEASAERTDSNGMSECQTYSYSPDPKGQIYRATLRKDGRYHRSGRKGVGSAVILGECRKYHDYSF